MLTRLKTSVQKWLAFEATIFHRLGFTPNHVSIFGLILALLSALTYWLWESYSFLLILAPLLMLASGFLDALDGIIARIYGETSTFGAFFDSILDRYADALILSGIILGGLTQISWGLIALFGSLMVSYTRARAEAAGVKMESIGLAERAERIVILTIASFLSLIWWDALNFGVLLLAILTNLTVIQRAVYFHKASSMVKIKND
ncbi:MAG: archaetidylinositol phosphate synthase [Candidatus Bathyarchaeota archaeon]